MEEKHWYTGHRSRETKAINPFTKMPNPYSAIIDRRWMGLPPKSLGLLYSAMYNSCDIVVHERISIKNDTIGRLYPDIMECL